MAPDDSNPTVDNAEAAGAAPAKPFDPVEFIFEVRQVFAAASRWFEANGDVVLRALQWAGTSYQRAQVLKATGWLPHYTTPEIPVTTDADALQALLTRHYSDNWSTVEAAFRERLATSAIDDEAKACFGEALTAHRQGLYRVAPRLLFPEIERLVRQDLDGLVTANAGLRQLRHAAELLGTTNLHRSGVLSLRLYETFTQHLYARIETPDERAKAEADPVPNRHAALHGVIVYNSQQSSLNALIMAEFALLTVSELRIRAPALLSQADIGAEPGDAFLLKVGYPWRGEGPYAWDRVEPVGGALAAPEGTRRDEPSA